jgi:hypothetical protein
MDLLNLKLELAKMAESDDSSQEGDEKSAYVQNWVRQTNTTTKNVNTVREKDDSLYDATTHTHIPFSKSKFPEGEREKCEQQQHVRYSLFDMKKNSTNIENRTKHLESSMDAHFDGFENRSLPLYNRTNKFDDQNQQSTVEILKDAFVSAIKDVSNNRNNNSDGMEKFFARQTMGVNLENFAGEPHEWLSFSSQFRRSTEICDYSQEENMSRLRKCLKGKAYEAVKMVVINSNDVEAAMTILEANFGRPETIISSLIDDTKSIPNVTSWKDFVQFSNSVLNLVATIENLEENIYMHNPLLLREFVCKLPPYIEIQWANFLMENDIIRPNLKNFSEWVKKSTAMITRAGLSLHTDPHPTTAKDKGACPKQQQQLVRPPLQNSYGNSRTCKICNKSDHSIDVCEGFRRMDVRQRWDAASKYKLCFSCLRNHSSYDCKDKKICNMNGCIKKHHRLLHKDVAQPPPEQVHVNDTSDGGKSVLLRIIPVVLKGPNGSVRTYALLDEASTVTLVETSLVEKIGVDGTRVPLCCRWTNDITRVEKDSKKVTFEISGATNEKFFELKGARTIDDLSLPTQFLNVEELHKRYPYVNRSIWRSISKAKPQILIGQDNASLIVTRNVIQPEFDSVVLSKCYLGWTAHGPVTMTGKLTHTASVNLCCEHADDMLHEQVKDFFKVESFGVALVKEEKERSVDDRKSLEIANRTFRDIGGRYEVGLPWRNAETVLPDSKAMALQRLSCLERKLNRDKPLADTYCSKIDELFTKGYAREVKMEELSSAKKVWFLPHFPVQNPSKPGKVRVVFDAAAKVKGSCLNDYLLAGPDWLTSLFGVLCKFREHRIAFTADIQEMFNQVHIIDEDTFAQCFLWRKLDVNSAPKIYQMKAMLFGTKSSPFLAQFVKNKNAEIHQPLYPEAAKAIIENHYVDDYLGGAESIEKAAELIREVIHVHEKGGFRLTKFVANSKEVLAEIPSDLVDVDKVSTIDKKVHERVLGVDWNSETDCFTFNLKFHKVNQKVIGGTQIPTKRDVLKTAMSLYDPLGFLVPITIKSKIFLQNIWRAGIGWDDEISSSMFDQWKKWLIELQCVTSIQIPRCYSLNLKEASSIQLHTFCDASEDAYSTVIFLRVEHQQKCEVSFVAAKARVAPLKTLTIPKLELMAAVAGSRLATTVREQLSFNIDRNVYWSDSRTVLDWLRSEKRLQSFIAARVGEISDLTNTADWRWVPTKLNVADDGTRDKPFPSFDQNYRWFKGPEFLYLDESEWPVTPEREDDEAINNDVIEEETVAVTVEFKIPVPDAERFSSWSKLLRATAWCNRFVKNCRTDQSNRKIGELTVDELEAAEKVWWLVVQEECFANDRKSFKTGQKFSCRLDKLSPMMDEEGVIRVASRIERAEHVSIAVKSPVILDGGHRYVQLMILHYHVQANHQGVETVINRLREKFWIIKCRSVVKKQFANCMYCRKYKAKPAQPMMGQLPAARFISQQKPFTSTGVDFFGPFCVAVGRRTEKRYGMLFTCLTIRAIHIEVTHDLSTSSCIMGIRRMIARRGDIRDLYSDNGTNLRGADREMAEAIRKLDNGDLHHDLANRRMQWHFIPPAAPHMGGSWERMIGTVKRALKSVMTGRRMNDETLLTVFGEVERIVNSRPLTHVSDDNHDPLSLTPNHFLIGVPEVNVSPGVFGDDECNWRRRWRVAQFLTDLFWKRWLKEYVPTLIHRKKWNRPEPNLSVGDLVVIEDKDLQRGLWPIGVVEDVMPGEDGIVRVVDVRTNRGVLRRPATKIHPFYRVGDVEPTPRGECGGPELNYESEEEFYGFENEMY